jgi:uncharacterized protein (TIGR02246 family)
VKIPLSIVRVMNRLLAIPLVMCLSAVASAAQTRPDSAGAVAAVEQFNAALAAADSARAMTLLADDVLVLESGAVQTRAEYLAHHLGADMKASQGSKEQWTVLKVSVIGDAAYVVSKKVSPPTGAQGSAGSESAELMVLSKTQSGWKIRAVHWSSRRRRPPAGG